MPTTAPAFSWDLALLDRIRGLRAPTHQEYIDWLLSADPLLAAVLVLCGVVYLLYAGMIGAWRADGGNTRSG